jgi:TolA-binding protein
MLASAPDHPRAPEAMLSVANCYVELRDTRSARRTLEEVMKTYPQTEAAIAAKERLAGLK